MKLQYHESAENTIGFSFRYTLPPMHVLHKGICVVEFVTSSVTVDVVIQWASVKYQVNWHVKTTQLSFTIKARVEFVVEW